MNQETQAARQVRLLITGVFVLLAVWFWFGPQRVDIPLPEPAIVAKSEIDPAPRRTPLTDPPMIVLGAFDRDCMDCHQIFKTAAERWRPLYQHTEIELVHGADTRCLNCHALQDRNRLVVYESQTVAFKDSDQLCGKCHGPVRRDWLAGTHGKIVGSWDRSDPDHRKLQCVECHDPHRPAYDAYAALPAPDTLRMGTPARPGDHTDNPLMRGGAK